MKGSTLSAIAVAVIALAARRHPPTSAQPSPRRFSSLCRRQLAFRRRSFLRIVMPACSPPDDPRCKRCRPIAERALVGCCEAGCSVVISIGDHIEDGPRARDPARPAHAADLVAGQSPACCAHVGYASFDRSRRRQHCTPADARCGGRTAGILVAGRTAARLLDGASPAERRVPDFGADHRTERAGPAPAHARETPRRRPVVARRCLALAVNPSPGGVEALTLLYVDTGAVEVVASRKHGFLMPVVA